MAILPIIEAPDPRLRIISKPVETFDKSLEILVADMFETMYEAPGIGLAAVQIGKPLRLLVIDLQSSDSDHQTSENGQGGNLEATPEATPEADSSEAPHAAIRNPRVFINPVLSEMSPEMAVYQEGCLSVPEQYADVERPSTITAEWQDIKGKKYRERMTGLMATCIQHEIDHLEGIIFIDHLSRLKRQMLLKKLAKLRRVA